MSFKDEIKKQKDAANAAKNAAKQAADAASKAKNNNEKEAHNQKEQAKNQAKAADEARKAAQQALINATNAAEDDNSDDDINAATDEVNQILEILSDTVSTAMNTKKDLDGDDSLDNDDFFKDFDKNGKCRSPRDITECLNCSRDNRPGITIGCCFKWNYQARKDLNAIVQAGGVVSWNSACSGRTVICGGNNKDAVTTAINILKYLKALGFIVA